MSLIKNIFVLILILVMPFMTISQVSVGTKTPSDKATFEIGSQVEGAGSYLGLMPPRVPSEIARNSITTTISDGGLLVYVESTGCLDIFNGQFWEHLRCASEIPIRTDIWINEFHYDNDGSDIGEFVEIAGVAGLDITGYELYFYNGASGTFYSVQTFSGTLPNDTGSGFGFAVINRPSGGIQNGSPDGLALVNPAGTIIQFFSYEGVFVGTFGPADGITSIDIGVQQSDDPTLDPVGASLQLTGSGSQYSDFTWARTQVNTSGATNTGQTFN